MSIENIERRWNQFLVKARERFEEVITDAVADCTLLLDHPRGDPRSITSAWTAARLRALGVRAKIDEIWTVHVRDEILACGAASRSDAAEARGEALADWMELELHQAETAVFANVCRKLLAALEAEGPRRCKSCGTAFEAGLVQQPVELPCPACAVPNPVEPSPEARLLVDYGPHLWREACWDLWVTKQQAELLVRRANEPTLAQLKAWEQAEIDYLCAWLNERSKLLPGAMQGGQAEMRERLELFYAVLEHESTWTRAGSPRALV